jgi:eukaryotic-like serine/threonine-protein kinase
MRCTYCKAENPPNAAACGKCGKAVPQSEATFVGNEPVKQPKPSSKIELPKDTNLASKGEDRQGTFVATKTPATPEGWSISNTRAPAPALPHGEFAPGTVLGDRYEILALLGQGGMGAVYKARDTELDRLVALKIIRPELTTNPEILKRFKQELILARQVTHRNVIRIFDLGQADGFKFITMEYLEGKDLRAVLREKGKLTPEEAARIILQICRALEAAHSEGVIHRDLKPQNIMLDANGRAYVMDFGIARSAYLPGMTQTGALIGTPEYMSPEQAKGEKLGEQSDLFSLGVILHELVIGQSPYYSETPLATLWKRLQEKAKPLCEVDSTIPKAFSDIVEKALEIEPENRYANAGEFAQHLESWLGISQSPITPITAPVLAPLAPKKSIAWKYAAIGFSAVLLLTVGGFALRGKLFSNTTGKAVAPSEPLVLAIIPLRNASGDASLNWLGGSLAEVLRTEVGQSAEFRTVSPDRLQQVMSDLRIAPDSEIAPSDLQRIADFTKAKLLVWGQYARVGDKIRIDAKLDDLKGQHTVPLNVEAAGETALLGAADKLAQTIQQNLSLGRGSVQNLKAAAFKPSSNSLEAIRAYTQGMAKARQGNYIDAVKEFESATTADANFALAYSMLGQTYARLGHDRDAEQSATRSVELSSNLPPVEKYIVQAVNAKIGNNYQQALNAYQNLERLMPSDPQVQFELGSLYQQHGEFDKAHEHYANTLQTDPKHIEALRNIGKVETDRGNPKDSLDYLNRALSLAVELNNRQGKATVLHDLGEAYKLLNRPQDALQNFQQSLEIKRQIGDKKGMAESLDQIAVVYYDSLGKSAEAEKIYKQELDIRKDLGDQAGLGVALRDFGYFLVNNGRNEEALSTTKQSLQIWMQLGNEPNQVTCLANIGAIYGLMAKYDDSLTYHHRAVDLLQKVQMPDVLAMELNNVGLAYFMIGQFDQAQSSYLRALDQARKIGSKQAVAGIFDGIAELFAAQGRLGAALSSQQDAVKNAQQMEQQSGTWVAEIQADYAHILNQLGRGQEAQKTLDESLGVARSARNDVLAAKVLNFQGENFYYRGDFKSARPLSERAQQSAAKAKERIQSLNARLNLAKVSIKEGHAAAAVNTLKGLRKEADSLAVKYIATQCSIALGEALLNSKDYSHAQDELQSAVRKSEDLGMKSLLPEGHYLLSQALRKNGSKAEADRHLQQASQLVEEMRQESKSDSLLQRADLKLIVEEARK